MTIMPSIPFASIPADPSDITECSHEPAFATFFCISPDYPNDTSFDEYVITFCQSCSISNALYLLLNLNNDELPD